MGFGGLYISISGLNANKKALDTTSHNISNVNNSKYVRQSVIHAESRYSLDVINGLQTGTGVDVQQIRQIRDEFLDAKVRSEMATFGYHNAKSEILGEIEVIFNEITSSGLQNVMDDFWNGWSELSKEPDSLTIRGLLHENGVAFATTVNHISTQLDNLQFNLNKEIINKAEETNQILEEIADLNKSIKLGEGYGNNITANDYRDSRNAKLDRLAELVPITYYENHYGEVVVSLNGRDLINGDYCNPIGIQLNEKGHGEIHWSDTGNLIELNGLGELGGYIDARDNDVVEYRERLNILVGTFAQTMNTLHQKGKDLDKNNGLEFFTFDENDPAATLRMNPELRDFTKIAVSKSGDKGDGEIAKAISNLRDANLFGEYDKYTDGETEHAYILQSLTDILDDFDTDIEQLFGSLEDSDLSMTTDGFYRDLILSLSLDRQEATSMTENQSMLISQIDGRRQEISAVSLDEEMVNMLNYQHAYTANSRVINAIDEMIDNMVNKMGVVGR